jgi:3-dehydroquinate synthase
MTTIEVALADAAYPVVVDSGLLTHLPGLLSEHLPAHQYSIVSDDNVGALYGHRVLETLGAAGFDASLVTFPAGEANKTRATWATITDELSARGLGRDGAVLALGGGVVGDMAGFVAATYLRGVRYAQVPTTLLAMVDSSIGGKTGVDTPAGKNLIGAFHHPAVVIADVSTLTTLEDRQFRAGIAETVKHGVVFDARYFEHLREQSNEIIAKDPAAVRELVCRSIEIKTRIIGEDPNEQGLRAVLNFGHTIGHAVEMSSSFEWLHGEAIAIGMVAEAQLAEKIGLAESFEHELRDALTRFRLPTRLQNVASDQVLRYMHHDKKNRAGAVRFALPRAIGSMVISDQRNWTVEVDDDTIKEFLDLAC